MVPAPDKGPSSKRAELSSCGWPAPDSTTASGMCMIGDDTRSVVALAMAMADAGVDVGDR